MALQLRYLTLNRKKEKRHPSHSWRRQLQLFFSLAIVLCPIYSLFVVPRIIFERNLNITHITITTVSERLSQLSSSTSTNSSSSTWLVSSFSSHPGLFLAQQEDDFSCVLYATNLCYAFNPTPTTPPFPSSSSNSSFGGYSDRLGLWYSQDPTSDISKIDFSKNVCSHYKSKLGGRFRNRRLYTGTDANDLPALQAKVGRFVHASLAQAYLGEADAILSPRHPTPVSSSASTSSSLPSPSSPSPCVVSPRDSHLGHFVEVVGGMAELGRHLAPQDWTIFFPMSRSMADWTAEICRILFGQDLTALTQHWVVGPTCFKEVVFPLQVAFSDSASQFLRDRAYEYAWGTDDKDGQKKTKRGRVSAIRDKKGASLRTSNDSSHRKLDTDFQVTVVKRVNNRFVLNLEEVISVVRKIFQGMAVCEVVLEMMSIKEQIQTMSKTALLVSMHGASLSNLVYLRQGASVLELLPYKFSYGVFKRLAARHGLLYAAWSNKHLNNTIYKDDCLLVGGFQNLTEHRCHLMSRCRACVRDKSTTIVHLGEISSLLKQISPRVKQWLRNV